MAQNVNRKMKKIWKEKLGRGGAPAHGSKSELVGLVVLVLSLLLLLVLSILAIGLVLTILAAGLHLVRILILHHHDIRSLFSVSILLFLVKPFW